MSELPEHHSNPSGWAVGDIEAVEGQLCSADDPKQDAGVSEVKNAWPQVQKEKEAVAAKEAEAARVFQVSYTVRAGGALLALCAGIVNAVAFHALSTFVSHLTGSLSRVGLGLEDSVRADAGDSVLLVVAFVVGSSITGFLIAKDTIHFGMALYDLCLLSEAGLLIAATFTHEHKIARYFAASACGLQNGMATHWGGAVIRTTHVTGLFTDVGLLLGRLLSLFCRKRCGAKFDDFDRAFVDDDISKLSVLLMIAVVFVIGVFTGAHLYNAMEHRAFLVPAGITGFTGFAYSIYRVAVLGQSFFSDAEMEAIDVPVEIQHEVENDIDLVNIEVSRKHSKAQQLENTRKLGETEHEVEDDGTECSSPQSRRSHHSRRSHSKGEVMSISRGSASRLEQTHIGLDFHHHH